MNTNTKMFAFLVPLLLASGLLNTSLLGPISSHLYGVVLLVENIPAEYSSIAIIVTLLIIVIAAIVFALAGIINSPNARTWSRMQIYEALLSLVMLLIFSFFAYLFLINPQGAFKAIGLLPTACSGGSVVDTFTLASCDISTFNNAAFQLAQTLYVGSYILGFTPGFTMSYTMTNQPFIKAEAGLPSIFSSSTETALSTSYNALLVMLMLNQVQMLLISASMLFLFTFFVIGIVARTFGFSRSFGGVMIAFALGLGLVYPILVSLTYGFINVQLQTYNEYTMIANLLISLASSLSVITPPVLADIMVSIGYYVSGLTFIPFINFLILDAFIVDFSTAIGERVNFMSLLSGMV